MDRLFLDANVLFSAAARPNAGLLELWGLEDAALCTSRYALEEARANLKEHVQHQRLNRLSGSLQLFEAEPGVLPSGISLPEKDVPILLAALRAGASHLLTGDIRRPVLRKKNQRHRSDTSRRISQSPKSRQVTLSFDVGQLTTKDVLHRNPNALLLRKRLGLFIPSVHVPDHTHPGIGGQHPLNALGHHVRSVGHQHLACV